MKTAIYITVIIILITLSQCESVFESNEHPEMDYRSVNINLIGVGKDTLDYSPWLWIFEIDSIENGYYAEIYQTWDDTLGSISDAFHYICVQDNGKLKVFDKDASISGSENWGKPEHNSFDNFKGKGGKYMDYKLIISSHETYIYYGWIRMHYSTTGDTLKIFDLAKSEEHDIPVKAGER